MKKPLTLPNAGAKPSHENLATMMQFLFCHLHEPRGNIPRLRASETL
jgi:hypothetical protein